MTGGRAFAPVLLLLSLAAWGLWWAWPGAFSGRRGEELALNPAFLQVAAWVFFAALIAVLIAGARARVLATLDIRRLLFARVGVAIALVPFACFLVKAALTAGEFDYDSQAATCASGGRTFSLYVTHCCCGAVDGYYLVEEVSGGLVLRKVRMTDHPEVAVRLLKVAATKERQYDHLLSEEVVAELEAPASKARGSYGLGQSGDRQ